MSGTIIRVDQLSETINKLLDEMNEQVVKKCNEAALKAANDGVKELKATSPVRTDGYNRKYPPGSYARSWTKRKEENAMGVITYTIHNSKHYQIAHLLEFGHAMKNGGRSKSIPHIAAVNDQVSEQFVREVEDMEL